MAPSTAASKSGGAKISAHSDLFDPKTLFVADKAAREEAAAALAGLSKNEGVSLFGAIGLPHALVQVGGARVFSFLFSFSFSFLSPFLPCSLAPFLPCSAS
jgi:hypothetical protein